MYIMHTFIPFPLAEPRKQSGGLRKATLLI